MTIPNVNDFIAMFHREAVEHFAVKKKVTYTLEDSLMNLTKDRLTEIRKNMRIVRASQLKKQELAQGIAGLLEKRENMRRILLNFTEDEMALFKELLLHRQMTGCSNQLMYYPLTMGLIFAYDVNGTVVFVVPDEVKAGAEAVLDDQFDSDHQELLAMDELFRALSNLYAAIDENRLLAVLATCGNTLLHKNAWDKMWSACNQLCYRERQYRSIRVEGREGLWIVNRLMMMHEFEDDFNELLVTWPAPYMPESYEDLLAFADVDNYRIGFGDEGVLDKWETLLKDIGLSEQTAQEDFLKELTNTFNVTDIEAVYDMLVRRGIGWDILEDYRVALAEIYTETYNNKRMWVYGGHTPKETGSEETVEAIGFPEEDPNFLPFDDDFLSEGFSPEEVAAYNLDGIIFREGETLTLPAMLNQMDAFEMEVLAEAFDIEYVEGCGEEAMADLLMDEMPGAYRKWLPLMSRKQLTLFDLIVGAGGAIRVEEVQQKMGLYAVELWSLYETHLILLRPDSETGEEFLILPREMMDIYQAESKALKKQCHKVERVLQMTRGLVHLYGNLAHIVAYELLQDYHVMPYDFDDYCRILELDESFREGYYEDDDGIWWPGVEIDDGLIDRMQRCDLPLKRFSKMAVSNASEVFGSFHNSAVKELESFYNMVFQVPKKEAREAVAELVEIFRGITDFDTFWQMSQMEMGLSGTPVEATYHKAVLDLYNSVPRWELKGNCVNDTKEKSEGQVISFATGKKVGRNDPCPCGSGQKYKRCCGK